MEAKITNLNDIKILIEEFVPLNSGHMSASNLIDSRLLFIFTLWNK